MNTKIVLSAVAVVVAFALIASPLVSEVLAGKKSQSNTANQRISQSNSNDNTQVCAGLANIACGINVNTQTNINTGSNVAVQSND